MRMRNMTDRCDSQVRTHTKKKKNNRQTTYSTMKNRTGRKKEEGEWEVNET